MSVNDLLTKDEINALLHGTSDNLITSDDELSSNNEETVSEQVDSDDSVGRSLGKKFPMLEMVNERFSGFFQLTLSRLLACNTEITLDRVQAVKFSDYSHSLFIPTSMNIVCFKPLDSIGLFVFDPKLVFMLADKYFGGEGRAFNISEGREFAPTELRVIEMILEKLFVTLSEAWSPVTVLEPEFIRSEVNPQYTNVYEQDDIVIVNTFRVSIDKAVGDLHVTMPYSMLQTLHKLSESIE